jgi:hypothetical protein
MSSWVRNSIIALCKTAFGIKTINDLAISKHTLWAQTVISLANTEAAAKVHRSAFPAALDLFSSDRHQLENFSVPYGQRVIGMPDGETARPIQPPNPSSRS